MLSLCRLSSVRLMASLVSSLIDGCLIDIDCLDIDMDRSMSASFGENSDFGRLSSARRSRISCFWRNRVAIASSACSSSLSSRYLAVYFSISFFFHSRIRCDSRWVFREECTCDWIIFGGLESAFFCLCWLKCYLIRGVISNSFNQIFIKKVLIKLIINYIAKINSIIKSSVNNKNGWLCKFGDKLKFSRTCDVTCSTKVYSKKYYSFWVYI